MVPPRETEEVVEGDKRVVVISCRWRRERERERKVLRLTHKICEEEKRKGDKKTKHRQRVTG